MAQADMDIPHDVSELHVNKHFRQYVSFVTCMTNEYLLVNLT